MDRKRYRTVTCAVLALLLFPFGCVHNGCVHNSRHPAPMPHEPEGACDSPDPLIETVNRAADPRDVIPVKRVEPLYPRRARDRGIQGWVCVMFTITEEGTVENLETLASAPQGYFEATAIETIRQWGYNPRIENGQAVDQPGVVVKLRFRLAP